MIFFYLQCNYIVVSDVIHLVYYTKYSCVLFPKSPLTKFSILPGKIFCFKSGTLQKNVIAFMNQNYFHFFKFN